MYVINDLMREIIASHYDKIIRKIIDELSYTGIDLLEVSFGGWVSVFLTQIGTINFNGTWNSKFWKFKT